MELIRKYFSDLTAAQMDLFAALGPLYTDWNEKINVISRKDIQHLYEHHVLHSLAIAKYNPFTTGMKILDAGTGGGFPGIPLAIVYPEVNFTLVDSIAKKILVANKVIEALELKNVMAIQARLEEHQGNYDIITSRAVSTLPQLIMWTKQLAARRWIVLKGGSPQEFRKELPPMFTVNSIPVGKYFGEEYFQGKYLVDVTLRP
jgi:16S rRNA (guanine527-N7)-methyltransferase